MKFIAAAIPEVIIIEPTIFRDRRGYFFEVYNQRVFERYIGKVSFVQDNESQSIFGTLRGLHYQISPFAQAKLIRVIEGKIWDVAVDIRKGSPTFMQWIGVELSEENKCQLFIPRGFAHGFVVLSKRAIVNYKVDNFYSPQCERRIIFNDPSLKIDWKIEMEKIILSEKDSKAPSIENAEIFEYQDPCLKVQKY